jgi:hypothetical protein
VQGTVGLSQINNVDHYWLNRHVNSEGQTFEDQPFTVLSLPCLQAGAAAGAGAGLLACIGLPIYGVVAGGAQVVSGVVNTPLSLSESVAWGRQWDEDAGEWFDPEEYSLAREAKAVLQVGGGCRSAFLCCCETRSRQMCVES